MELDRIPLGVSGSGQYTFRRRVCQEWAGLVRIPLGVSRNSLRSEWEWSGYLQETGVCQELTGLVRILLGVSRNFLMSRWDWLEFLQEYVALVRILSSEFGQNSFRNAQEFLWEQVGIVFEFILDWVRSVRIPLGVRRNSLRSRWDCSEFLLQRVWSEFLQECAGIPLGAGGIFFFFLIHFRLGVMGPNSFSTGRGVYEFFSEQEGLINSFGIDHILFWVWAGEVAFWSKFL